MFSRVFVPFLLYFVSQKVFCKMTVVLFQFVGDFMCKWISGLKVWRGSNHCDDLCQMCQEDIYQVLTIQVMLPTVAVIFKSVQYS